MASNASEYLNELNNGKYTQLPNGTYYAQLSNGNEIYIPASLGNDMNLLAYAPGSGGSAYDAVHLRDMCKSDNPPNCVVTISSSCEDRNNILELGTNAIESLGSNVNNVVYASFSASEIKGFQRGSTYLQNHDVDSFSIISCDGCGSYEFLNDRKLSQDFAILKEKNVPIKIIQGAQTYKVVYERLINNDYNACYLTVDSSRRNHMTTNYDMSDNLLLYALGEVDDIPENS